MPESLALNDTPLNTLVSNAESIAGLLQTPARRGEPLLVPGRHGRLRSADRPFEAGEMVLPFWVIGADAATGATLTGDAAVTSFYARVDELVSLLHAPTLRFDHTLPNASVRRILAELADEPLDFTRQFGSPLFGRVSALVAIPDAFWFDPVETTSGPHSLATGGTVELTGFAGATAPMADLSITFTGPINNPELHQTATGAFVAYDGVIAPGQSLTVHCDDTLEAPLVGAGGLVPDYTLLRYKPPRWFELTPSAGLTVELRHTGGGSASFTVVGHKKYLTG